MTYAPEGATGDKKRMNNCDLTSLRTQPNALRHIVPRIFDKGIFFVFCI
jgi:hypothetical protein